MRCIPWAAKINQITNILYYVPMRRMQIYRFIQGVPKKTRHFAIIWKIFSRQIWFWYENISACFGYDLMYSFFWSEKNSVCSSHSKWPPGSPSLDFIPHRYIYAISMHVTSYSNLRSFKSVYYPDKQVYGP